MASSLHLSQSLSCITPNIRVPRQRPQARFSSTNSYGSSNTSRQNVQTRTNLKRIFVASSSEQSVASPVSSDASLISNVKEIVPDSEISITKTSFGTIGLSVGLSLLSYGFGAYFTLLPGTEWSAIMLTYGFPIALIGFALKYAELKPVPCESFKDAVALRDKEATPILVQVRSDVTRFRYGDEQHLEEALKRIFRYGLSGGVQRRNAPVLTAIAEQVYDGKYSLVLKFDAPALPLEEFTQRQAKFTSFFGPGVEALIEEAESKKYNVRLVATGK